MSLYVRGRFFVTFVVRDHLAPLVGGRLAPGEGALAFRRRASGSAEAVAKTVVETVTARGPTKLLTPKNHGHGAWAFVASFGGGLVDGDRPKLTVDVHEGATALLGTQSSTKIYRAKAPVLGEAALGCHQTLDARVASGATLVVVPDPVTCFRDARYAQESTVALAGDASLLLVDGLTSGRSARGERWAFARYASRVRILRDGVLAVNDAVVLDPAQGELAPRMGRFDTLIAVFAVGPKLAPLRARALATAPALARRADVVQSLSVLGGDAKGASDAMLLRIAAASVEQGLLALRALVAAPLNELLGDNPFARKW